MRSIESLKNTDGVGIYEALTKTGFCVVNTEGGSGSIADLLGVASWLGEVQDHVRRSVDGVIGEYERSVRLDWVPFREEYVSLGTNALQPHTDGAYLDGVVATRDGTLHRIGPPKFVALQCVAQSSLGGDNILIDASRVARDLGAAFPETFGVLCRHGCVTFCRDDLFVAEKPIFERFGGNRLRVRFRYDAHIYAPRWSQPAINKLHTEYNLNPLYQVVVKLEPGQILIVDNHRMLHGRTAFSEGGRRHFRKVWIYDETLDHLYSVSEGTGRINHRALLAFMAYDALSGTSSAEQSRDQRRSIATGILIDEELAQRLDSTISRDK